MSNSNPWPQAAERLARRVNGRARQSAVLGRLGPAVLAGGLTGVVARLLGAPQTSVIAALAGGLAIGLVLGLRRTFAVKPVSPADAAWALDRVAEGGEHGLAAAVISDPIGQQAAALASEPPAVRMVPPRGLAWMAAGLLAAGVAWMAPGRDDDAGAADDLGGPAGAISTAGGASADASTGLADVAKVRQALNLPTDGALNREAVAKQFADPAARNRALKAAGKGSVAERLQQGDNSAEALAQGLLDADQAARAAALGQRRREAEAHARASLHTGASARVPAHRRGVVKRYLERLAP